MGTCARRSLSDSFWTRLFLQSNNHILLPAMTLPPLLTVNNDSAESVQREALNHFKATTFTSYTEVRPEDSTILLVLGKKGNPPGETIKVKMFFFSTSTKFHQSFIVDVIRKQPLIQFLENILISSCEFKKNRTSEKEGESFEVIRSCERLNVTERDWDGSLQPQWIHSFIKKLSATKQVEHIWRDIKEMKKLIFVWRSTHLMCKVRRETTCWPFRLQPMAAVDGVHLQPQANPQMQNGKVPMYVPFYHAAFKMYNLFFLRQDALR